MPVIKNSILITITDEEIPADGSFDVPPGVTALDDWALGYTPSLQKITLQGVTSIGLGALHNCYSLQEISSLTKLTHIGGSGFKGCTRLQKIDLPAITFIGSDAFEDCTSLREINLPAKITYMGNGVFSNCTNLQKITLPSGITSIGEFTFNRCSNLQEIYLPAGINLIAENAFNECDRLRCIVIDSNNTAEIEHTRRCTPEHLRSKVISKSLARAIEERTQAQLKKVMKNTTNPLFSFLSINGLHGTKKSIKQKITLPEVLLGEINTFLLDENPYYKEAKSLMTQIPIPINEEGLNEFEEQLAKITHTVCAKADKKRETTLKLTEHALVRAEAEKAAAMKKAIEQYKEGYVLWLGKLDSFKNQLTAPRHQQVSNELGTLYTRLNTAGEDFFKNVTTESYQEFQNTLIDRIKQVLEGPISQHRGWHGVAPILKGILGVLALIAAIPALIIECTLEGGYMGTFWKAPPETRSKRELLDLKEKLDSLSNTLDADFPMVKPSS